MFDTYEYMIKKIAADKSLWLIGNHPHINPDGGFVFILGNAKNPTLGVALSTNGLTTKDQLDARFANALDVLNGVKK